MVVGIFAGMQLYAQEVAKPVSVAVPFLNVSGNSHQMASGFMGVTASVRNPETGFTGNPALLANGISYLDGRRTHMAWMPGGSTNATHFFTESLAYSTGRHAVGIFARVLEHSEVNFTDVNGNRIGANAPWESSFQLNYATWFPKGWSVGIGLRYIHSNLSSGLNVGGYDTKAAHALAADIGTHYRKYKQFDEKRGIGFGIGFSLNNVGSKISYRDNDVEGFQPMNGQLGGQVNASVTFGKVRIEQDLGYQVMKLLVPTSPSYYKEVGPDGQPSLVDSTDGMGNRIIAAGYDPNVSVLQGMIQSFYDAPLGASEEWQEVIHMQSYCLRAVLSDFLALSLRQGFHYQHGNKGNNTFLTFGGGITFYGAKLEAGGIIPVAPNSALGGTFFVGVGYALMFKGEGKKYRIPEMKESYWEKAEE